MKAGVKDVGTVESPSHTGTVCIVRANIVNSVNRQGVNVMRSRRLVPHRKARHRNRAGLDDRLTKLSH